MNVKSLFHQLFFKIIYYLYRENELRKPPAGYSYVIINQNETYYSHKTKLL